MPRRRPGLCARDKSGISGRRVSAPPELRSACRRPLRSGALYGHASRRVTPGLKGRTAAPLRGVSGSKAGLAR